MLEKNTAYGKISPKILRLIKITMLIKLTFTS